MALGPKIVDLVWLAFLNDTYQVAAVCEVPIVQEKPPVGFMRVLIEVVDSLCVKKRRAPFDAVDLITFVEEKFCQVGAILTGDTRDQGCLSHVCFSWDSFAKAAFY